VNYITIADNLIGHGLPCFIIAEVGNAHDGSLGTAHAYIDAIARTGASAVKFQTHIAAAESTKAEQFRVPFSYQDASRYDYWKRLEFTQAQWAELADHAEERGLVFLSTPFSREAVEMLSGLVPAWKVGSGEVTNPELLKDIRTTGLPVLLSSGMASWEELETAVASLEGSPLAVLQCTTAYPCTPEQVGLNVLSELRQQYECPVGLSDHSGTIYASLAAATLGANVQDVPMRRFLIEPIKGTPPERRFPRYRSLVALPVPNVPKSPYLRVPLLTCAQHEPLGSAWTRTGTHTFSGMSSSQVMSSAFELPLLM